MATDTRVEKSRKIMNDSDCPVEAKEELLCEYENIWREMEKHQNKLTLITGEPVGESDAKVSLLQMQAVRAECNQWQKRNPEILSTNPEILLFLGDEELQKIKEELEAVLSAVQCKNEKLKEDLERVYQELKNQALELKEFKKKLIKVLDELLEEHFPFREKNGNDKKKRYFKEPSEREITIHEILETLLNQLISAPHEPYVTVDGSFWPPYLELLLRSGIVLRHPEDPSRIRLEAFHE
ncbi:centromere protein K isoform X4 [Coturnix japonica]|uniref:centromere protein K isoform X4 n=1 Tax=Coturnix japonica TaxID=93934 RepID=UPI000776EE47|nr:centromere protein K isoform X4 [Coturnix japonica]